MLEDIESNNKGQTIHRFACCAVCGLKINKLVKKTLNTRYGYNLHLIDSDTDTAYQYRHLSYRYCYRYYLVQKGMM